MSLGFQAACLLDPGLQARLRRRRDLEVLPGLLQAAELQAEADARQRPGLERDDLARAGERPDAADRLDDRVGLLLVQHLLGDVWQDGLALVGQIDLHQASWRVA